MADDTNDTQGSPRYVDESIEADPNLRPNPDETEERGTDREPNSEGSKEE